MKVVKLGTEKVIMSNPDSKHNYFAWPTAVRLKNGRIAVGASGFRLNHVCPFGKTVISFSENDGETYSLPSPVFDTVLDDRDAGLCTFGESGLIVTSFNNSVEFQRMRGEAVPEGKEKDYRNAYLAFVDPEEQEKYLGASFRISYDNGTTFGPIYKSPITSPHGPIELKDGTILWVGRAYSHDDKKKAYDHIAVYTINTENGEMEHVGDIDNIDHPSIEVLSCEPYAIELPDGSIICHVRVQGEFEDGSKMLTLYQTKSYDKGRTWTKPRLLFGEKDGAPSHMLLHSSGTLVCTYGRRIRPFGVLAMISKDYGETWEDGQYLHVNEYTADLGYPSTVELSDGSMLTIFYAHEGERDTTPAVIMQQKWKMEE